MNELETHWIKLFLLKSFTDKLQDFAVKNYRKSPGYEGSPFQPEEYIRVWIDENREDAILLCKMAVELVTAIEGNCISTKRKHGKGSNSLF